jgi:DNA-binding NtrC family response regulator
MNNVLLVIKNDKIAQTIIGACHDRGTDTRRLDNFQVAMETITSQPEPEVIALIIDLAEFNTKSDKKINQTLVELSQKVKVLGLGSGYDLKSVTSFYRSGLFDYLNLPLDPIDLTRALNKILGTLSQDPGNKAGGNQRPPVQSVSTGKDQKSTSAGLQSEIKTASINTNSPKGAESSSFAFIVGQDPGLMEVFRIVEKVANTDSTVMVHGESGTGKELIARAIHQASSRKTKPMIPVNCGAIPEELLETELFGHEKGAFTNAIRDRIGRFEMADGGTIFLDEIGDMSAKLQVKLLRVIQEHEFERVGGDKTISIDIRIITATHVDLTRAVKDGRFREDLYYRLNVIPITIPPLRERSGDVPLLIDYFLNRLKQTRGTKVTGITQEVKNILAAYRWPGNVRELENLMERMVILADAPILTKNDLPLRLLQEVEVKVLPISPKEEPDSQLGEEQNSDTEQGQGPDFTNLSSQLDFFTPPEPAEHKKETILDHEPKDQELVSVELDRDLADLIAPVLNFPESGVDLSLVINNFEDRLIKAALSANNGVKNHAAKALGLNRTTFLEKLKKKGLD